MTVDRTNLTDALVLESGGWTSAYARVLLTVADENVGFVLVDGNGDGAELEMEYWCRGDNGWEAGSSTGEGRLDDLATKRWDAGSMVCAVGRGVPGESMLLRYDGADCECAVNQFGLWGFVRKVEGMDVKHQLPDLLFEDETATQARTQLEAKMEVLRERTRDRLRSSKPPTA